MWLEGGEGPSVGDESPTASRSHPRGGPLHSEGPQPATVGISRVCQLHRYDTDRPAPCSAAGHDGGSRRPTAERPGAPVPAEAGGPGGTCRPFVPRHVVRALDRFGHCGDPTLGFALLRCPCGSSKVVPVRCHGRSLCPTCGGRHTPPLTGEPSFSRGVPACILGVAVGRALRPPSRHPPCRRGWDVGCPSASCPHQGELPG